MTTTISPDDLAEHLTDILERVCKQFVVEHNGKPIAMLSPFEEKKEITWAEFIDHLRSIPPPDDKFADDLEEIISWQQPLPDPPEWPR